MKKFFSALIFSIYIFTSSTFANINETESSKPLNTIPADDSRFLNDLYNILLSAGEYPEKEVLQKAINGYARLKEEGSVREDRNLLTIIDFSKSSNTKRLWTIDLDNREVLHNTYVAHGRNSGNEYAKTFSNIPNSYTSSLGFYLTAETYYGKHGLSLRLDGVENDINHNARKRAIVIHGADYVSTDFIKRYGRLGRSYGCPSVPMDQHKEIIDTIKEGSVLFIYAPDNTYTKTSELIHKKI